MKFSIVTICLNAAGFIEEAMNSVLSQDWPDFEYILVDGGSRDGTQELIRQVAIADSRIRMIVVHERGISHAMNRGLALASGEVIAFLHADDRYTGHQILKKVGEAFGRSPTLNWLTGGIKEINVRGETLRTLLPRRYLHSRLLWNNIIFHPATFVRLGALRRAGGFDEGLRYAMDYDLWLRLAAQSPPGCCQEVLADFRVHEGSLSSSRHIETLQEEYQVRLRYLGSGPTRWLHACYQRYRLALERNR